jgi:excisionase family DNA binding protein
MFPAIPSKSYEPDVDRFGWQAGSVLERIATQRGGIVVTARNQVGSQSPYRTVRNWQSPRSYESPLRPAPAAAAGPDDGEQLEVLLRTTEVARRLQVSARTVLAWAQAGKLPSILTPGGHRRYPAQGVEQVLATMTAAGEPRVDDE